MTCNHTYRGHSTTLVLQLLPKDALQVVKPQDMTGSVSFSWPLLGVTARTAFMPAVL